MMRPTTDPNAASNTVGQTLGSTTHVLAYVRDTVADTTARDALSVAAGHRVVVIADTTRHATGTVHAYDGSAWAATTEGPLTWQLIGRALARQQLAETDVSALSTALDTERTRIDGIDTRVTSAEGAIADPEPLTVALGVGTTARHIEETGAYADAAVDITERRALDITGGEAPITVSSRTIRALRLLGGVTIRSPRMRGMTLGANRSESGKPFGSIHEAILQAGAVEIPRYEQTGPIAFSGNTANQHGGVFNYIPGAHFGTVLIDGGRDTDASGMATVAEMDGWYSKGLGTRVEHLVVRNMPSATTTNVLCNVKGGDNYSEGSLQAVGVGQSFGTVILIGNGSRSGESFAASNQLGFQTECSHTVVDQLIVENCLYGIEIGSGEGGGSVFSSILLSGPDSYHLRDDAQAFHPSSIAIGAGALVHGGLTIPAGRVEGYSMLLRFACDLPDEGGVHLGAIRAIGTGEAGTRVVEIGGGSDYVKGFFSDVVCDDGWADFGSLERVHGFEIRGRIPNVYTPLTGSSADLVGTIRDQHRVIATTATSQESVLRLPIGGVDQVLTISGRLLATADDDSWSIERPYRYVADHSSGAAAVVGGYVGVALTGGTPPAELGLAASISTNRAVIKITPSSAAAQAISLGWSATWTKLGDPDTGAAPSISGVATIGQGSTQAVIARAALGTDAHWVLDFVITAGDRLGQRGQADIYAVGASGAVYIEEVLIGPASLNWRYIGETVVIENLTANNETVKYWGFKKA